MQVYILMQSAGAPAGPFGQAAQNADERRRAVCRAALRVSSVSGVGAAVGAGLAAVLLHGTVLVVADELGGGRAGGRP